MQRKKVEPPVSATPKRVVIAPSATPPARILPPAPRMLQVEDIVNCSPAMTRAVSAMSPSVKRMATRAGVPAELFTPKSTNNLKMWEEVARTEAPVPRRLPFYN